MKKVKNSYLQKWFLATKCNLSNNHEIEVTAKHCTFFKGSILFCRNINGPTRPTFVNKRNKYVDFLSPTAMVKSP